MDEWRGALLEARKRLGVGRGRLAEMAGVSVETLRGYEIGRRHPKHDTLEAIVGALRLERVQANRIRESAGFAPVHSLFAGEPEYFYSVEDLQDAVEEVAWPEFVTNDSYELVAANAAACALWRVESFAVERARRQPTELNLLAIANERHFPEQVGNWDELIETLAGMYKSQPLGGGAEELASPSPYLAQVIAHFTRHGPGFLARLLSAWGRAKPIPPKVRWTYRITWNHPLHGTMRFHALVSTANEREGLAFNDWVPLDGETWSALRRLGGP